MFHGKIQYFYGDFPVRYVTNYQRVWQYNHEEMAIEIVHLFIEHGKFPWFWKRLPSGYQTWLAGKFLMTGFFDRKIT